MKINFRVLCGGDSITRTLDLKWSFFRGLRVESEGRVLNFKHGDSLTVEIPLTVSLTDKLPRPPKFDIVNRA